MEIENYINNDNVLWDEFNKNMILSPLGEENAKKLCNVNELKNIDEIYASNSSRAIETAKYLAETNNIKIKLDERINEDKRLSYYGCTVCHGFSGSRGYAGAAIAAKAGGECGNRLRRCVVRYRRQSDKRPRRRHTVSRRDILLVRRIQERADHPAGMGHVGMLPYGCDGSQLLFFAGSCELEVRGHSPACRER